MNYIIDDDEATFLTEAELNALARKYGGDLLRASEICKQLLADHKITERPLNLQRCFVFGYLAAREDARRMQH